VRDLHHSTICIVLAERLTYNLAVIVDNWLYIDAGEYYTLIDNTINVVPCELFAKYLNNAA
jgi:hypothetical protein